MKELVSEYCEFSIQINEVDWGSSLKSVLSLVGESRGPCGQVLVSGQPRVASVAISAPRILGPQRDKHQRPLCMSPHFPH